MFAKVSRLAVRWRKHMCLKFWRRSPEKSDAEDERAFLRGWQAHSHSGLTHRSVGPMQLVSVLSISRRMRSCSAAVSTLAILHVAVLNGLERLQTGWEEEPQGGLGKNYRAAWVGGDSLGFKPVVQELFFYLKQDQLTNLTCLVRRSVRAILNEKFLSKFPPQKI